MGQRRIIQVKVARGCAFEANLYWLSDPEVRKRRALTIPLNRSQGRSWRSGYHIKRALDHPDGRRSIRSA
jgi:hypothetical protein